VTPSHIQSSKPSPLLAVLCVALIHRVRPAWLAVGVAEAAATESLSAERVSRLTSRAVVAFEEVVVRLTQRGRPTTSTDARATSDDVRELGRLRALLAVATAVLACVPLRGIPVRALITGAWTRLAKEHPAITKAAFCAALSLPERTLRDWLTRGAPPAKPETAVPPTRKPRKPRPPRRPRFRFDVFLGGTQIGSDTTSIEAFGVPLKLVAAQDIGGRDAALFESVVIDTRETSEHVARVLGDAVAGRDGIQAITDQGTAFLAEATRQAMAALGAEHAPQKEGDPCGKSTVERGFRSLKDLCAPLLSLSNALAERFTALRDPKLATAWTELVVGVALRAYQAGARAKERALRIRGAMSEEELLRAAEKARAAARATERSARLLLAHIHDIYGLRAPVVRFINGYRLYPLDVLRDAEARLRAQLTRGNDIRDTDRYFAALVRSAYAEHRTACAQREGIARDAERRDQQTVANDARYRAWRADPAAWLRDALDAVAANWLPDARALLFDGEGIGLGWTRAALARLFDGRSHDAAADIAHGVERNFRIASRARLGEHGVDAVIRLLRRELERYPDTPNDTSVAGEDAASIMQGVGILRRPAATSALRI
jgi:hypothetical protein